MKEFKIKVPYKELSEIVQKRLFELGYRWDCGGTNFNHQDSKHLVCFSGGRIAHGFSVKFSCEPKKEIQISDLWNEYMFFKEPEKSGEIEKIDRDSWGECSIAIVCAKLNEVIDRLNKVVNNERL